MSKFLSDQDLLKVEKPSRYVGNELNSIVKDLDCVKLRFAFCFPDVYEVGMSHLGMKILYHMINERPNFWCERVFAPWVDMEALMRERNVPLWALESKDAIRDFDFIGFTLQYEMSYTNILNILDLAGIPILAANRGEDFPLVCAGGPCAVNPEPLAEFIDFFVIGEGEEVILEILDAYQKAKKLGISKKDYLKQIASMEGIYVPSLYEVTYHEDGRLKDFQPLIEGIPHKIKKRIIKEMENAYYPEKLIVPFMDIIHDRIMLELFRGCIRGCRFCQAGFIYRPVREKSPERLFELAHKLVENTGYEEISLTSLSTSDYTGFMELAQKLMDEMESKRVNLALPSLRVDAFSIDLMEKAQKVRKSGLTFAPEAGSQRLRDVINKGVTEDDLINSVTIAFGGGWNSVKLYFMLGLPTETQEDIAGIHDLSEKVITAYMRTPKEYRGKGFKITISTSSFVPKPFTPFQWEAQDTMDVLVEKQYYLKNLLKSRFVSYNWHDAKLSHMEAVFSRGDRRLSKVLKIAWEKGCRFDAWGEYFKYDQWISAFSEAQISPSFFANRKRGYDEILPWDHIDVGVTKKFLINENEKANQQEVTKNCKMDCSHCGAASFGGGICFDQHSSNI